MQLWSRIVLSVYYTRGGRRMSTFKSEVAATEGGGVACTEAAECDHEKHGLSQHELLAWSAVIERPISDAVKRVVVFLSYVPAGAYLVADS